MIKNTIENKMNTKATESMIASQKLKTKNCNC